MQRKLLFAAILAGTIALATAPYALAEAVKPGTFRTEAMHYMKSMKVPLSEDRSLNVHILEMDGKRMALVPIEELNALLSRAEGHSMNIGN
jgi:hypothetical protein